MRVELTRSGGIAGLTTEASADTEELPEPEAKELHRLVSEIDLDDLADRSPIRGSGADRFQYDVTVRGDEGERKLTVSEDAAPAAVRSLVSWLQARGGAQRPT